MKEENFTWEQVREIALQIKQQNFFEIENTSPFIVEAWKRTFVSRIYYSCFHKSVEVAEEITTYKKLPQTLEFYYDRNKVHGEVRAFYKNLSKEYPLPKYIKNSCYQIATEIKELHDMRKDCDYTKYLPNEKINFFCIQSFNLSEHILSELVKISEHFQSKKTKS